VDPLVLSAVIEATDGLLTGVTAAADRKMFLKSISNHFAKNYTVDLQKWSGDEKEQVRTNSVLLFNAKKLHGANAITEDVRSVAGDLCLGIAWHIIENDLGLFGLQKHTRAVGIMFGWNKDNWTHVCKQLVSEGHLESLRNLSNGKQVDKLVFNSLKRAMKRIIDLV